jgi:hypothetical protein
MQICHFGRIKNPLLRIKIPPLCNLCIDGIFPRSRWLCFNHKVRRRKGGTYPLSHLYGHFGLVRLSRLGHDVSWVKA